MRCLWRETALHDVGIDGLIELVNADGEATARMLGVQIKSGHSYFEEERGGNVIFRPDEKHAKYWRVFPIEVVLMLFDPESRSVCWAPVKQQLQANPAGPILVPKGNVLSPTSRAELFGKQDTVPISLIQTVMEMLESRIGDPSGISYFSLFANGMTDLCRKLYFGMDLFTALLESNWPDELTPQRIGIGIGSLSYAFIDRYIAFLISNDICQIRYEDYWQVVEERQMVGEFIAPLTERGKAVVSMIHRLEATLPIAKPLEGIFAIQERSVGMEFVGSGAIRLSYVEMVAVALRSQLAIQSEGGAGSSGS